MSGTKRLVCPPNWKLATYAQDPEFLSPQNTKVLQHLMESTNCGCHWMVNALTKRFTSDGKPAASAWQAAGATTAANSDHALGEPRVNAPAAQA